MPPRRPATRNREGSPRKLASGRWQARFVEDGVEVKPTPGVTYETKALAQQAVTEYKVDRRRGTLPTRRETRRLDVWAWEWWDAHTAGLAANTRADYHTVLKSHILRPGSPLLGLNLDQVTPMTIRSWYRFLKQPYVTKGKQYQQVNPATRVKANRILGTLFRAAKSEGFCASIPNEGMSPVRRGEVRESTRPHFFFYLAELARLTAACEYIPEEPHEHWPLYYSLLAWTGCRPSEIRALTPAQVLTGRQIVRIDAAISDGGSVAPMERGGTKGGRWRFVYLVKPVADLLEQVIVDWELGPNDLIFTQRDLEGPTHSTTLRTRGWYAAVGIAGIESDPMSLVPGRHLEPVTYDLRASLISHMLAAGLPAVEVRAQVGHQDQSVTDLYTVVQTSGAEDPITVAARREAAATRGEILEYLYAEAQRTL